MLAQAGCDRTAPDFSRILLSPSGHRSVRISAYHPRGPAEAYLTMAFGNARKDAPAPQLVLGHMMKVNAGWLDEHRFAIIYDVLETRQLQSPLYPAGDSTSVVELVTCNRRLLDCGALARQLAPRHSIAFDQFPRRTLGDLRMAIRD